MNKFHIKDVQVFIAAIALKKISFEKIELWLMTTQPTSCFLSIILEFILFSKASFEGRLRTNRIVLWNMD
jgi:hypothetical protein